MVDFSAAYNPLLQAEQAKPDPFAGVTQALGASKAVLENQLLAGAIQKQQPEIDDARLQNALNHTNTVLAAMSPALAMGNNVTMDAIQQGARKAVQMGIPANEVSDFLTNLPPNADGPTLYRSLQGHQLALMNAQDRIATMRGQRVTTDTGGNIQVGTQSNFDNSYTPVTSFRKTMDPASAIQPVAGPVDQTTGAETTETAGERAEQAGLAAPGTYTNGGSGASNGSTAIPINIRNGRITQRQPMTAAPSITPAGASGGFGSGDSATMPSGPIQTKPSPGQKIALDSGGNQYAAAVQNAGTYGQQMTQLQSALTALQNTTTGPGTEARQAIASYMLALPGGLGQYLPGVNPKSIASYDEANKYLTQTAQGTPNATRSDAGLNTALASSPSVHISNAAAQDVLKANIGFRRAEMANVMAWQKAGLDPGQYPQWLARRQQGIDPRAYSIDTLSPPQRSAFLSTLSGSAKTKFLNSVRDAISTGQIDPGSLQSTGGQSAGQ